MNWSHFSTMLWVRYRLAVNHIRRYGALNAIILAVFSGLALIGSVTGFCGVLIAGIIFLPDASPNVLMYLCDAWLLGYLFFWMLGVMTDLQRGDLLSVEKLLHLPTSLSEVFVFNFLSSLISLTTVTFVPPMIGFCFAAVVTKGAAALVMLPLAIAFVLSVAAVTYQFRGWLATLMANKRRQRAIVVMVTFVMVLAMQAPQLLNLAYQRHRNRARAEQAAQRDALINKLRAREITQEEYDRDFERIHFTHDDPVLGQLGRGVEIANMVLPIGWLAYGSKAAAAGNPWPGLGGVLGLTGVSVYCLRRSYHTTLRFYIGEFTGATPRETTVPAVAPAVKDSGRVRTNPIERTFPFVPDPPAAVACATLTSLLRAPEAKMMLLGPVIMLLVFGVTLLPNLGAQGTPDIVRSLVPLGALGLIVSGVAQLTQNLFAFDRSGFRAYVLSGVPRHQILLGKNLGVAPFVFIPALLLMTLIQFFAVAPFSGFAAALVSLPTAFLWLCLLGNYSSMVCPFAQAAGTVKPANVSGVMMLLQFVFLMMTASIVGTVALIPLGIEWLLQWAGWVPATVPVAFVLALLELGGSVVIYRLALVHQGEILQSRECRILEAVSVKGE